jgi:hypothetical protein
MDQILGGGAGGGGSGAPLSRSSAAGRQIIQNEPYSDRSSARRSQEKPQQTYPVTVRSNNDEMIAGGGAMRSYSGNAMVNSNYPSGGTMMNNDDRNLSDRVRMLEKMIQQVNNSDAVPQSRFRNAIELMETKIRHQEQRMQLAAKDSEREIVQRDNIIRRLELRLTEMENRLNEQHVELVALRNYAKDTKAAVVENGRNVLSLEDAQTAANGGRGGSLTQSNVMTHRLQQLEQLVLDSQRRTGKDFQANLDMINSYRMEFHHKITDETKLRLELAESVNKLKTVMKSEIREIATILQKESIKNHESLQDILQKEIQTRTTTVKKVSNSVYESMKIVKTALNFIKGHVKEGFNFFSEKFRENELYKSKVSQNLDQMTRFLGNGGELYWLRKNLAKLEVRCIQHFQQQQQMIGGNHHFKVDSFRIFPTPADLDGNAIVDELNDSSSHQKASNKDNYAKKMAEINKLDQSNTELQLELNVEQFFTDTLTPEEHKNQHLLDVFAGSDKSAIQALAMVGLKKQARPYMDKESVDKARIETEKERWMWQQLQENRNQFNMNNYPQNGGINKPSPNQRPLQNQSQQEDGYQNAQDVFARSSTPSANPSMMDSRNDDAYRGYTNADAGIDNGSNSNINSKNGNWSSNSGQGQYSLQNYSNDDPIDRNGSNADGSYGNAGSGVQDNIGDAYDDPNADLEQMKRTKKDKKDKKNKRNDNYDSGNADADADNNNLYNDVDNLNNNNVDVDAGDTADAGEQLADYPPKKEKKEKKDKKDKKDKTNGGVGDSSNSADQYF